MLVPFFFRVTLGSGGGSKTVCVVSCQRSPEPVFLKWKGLEAKADGDFFVRSGPGTVKLSEERAAEYIGTRFPGYAKSAET
jgi:hypothetical protein